MLVAGTGAANSGPATEHYLWALRRHKIRTVIRPNNGRTTFTSTWTIEWPSFPLRLEGPADYRAFLSEASREKPALPPSTKRNFLLSYKSGVVFRLRAWRQGSGRKSERQQCCCEATIDDGVVRTLDYFIHKNRNKMAHSGSALRFPGRSIDELSVQLLTRKGEVCLAAFFSLGV